MTSACRVIPLNSARWDERYFCGHDSLGRLRSVFRGVALFIRILLREEDPSRILLQCNLPKERYCCSP